MHFEYASTQLLPRRCIPLIYDHNDQLGRWLNQKDEYYGMMYFGTTEFWKKFNVTSNINEHRLGWKMQKQQQQLLEQVDDVQVQEDKCPCYDHRARSFIFFIHFCRFLSILGHKFCTLLCCHLKFWSWPFSFCWRKFPRFAAHSHTENWAHVLISGPWMNRIKLIDNSNDNNVVS